MTDFCAHEVSAARDLLARYHADVRAKREARIAEIKRLDRQGYSAKDIAPKVGMSVSGVYPYMHNHHRPK